MSISNRFFICSSLLVFAAFGVSSCVSEGSNYRAPHAKAASGTWRCDGGKTMRIKSMGSKVQVQSPHGDDVVLPASPPDSRSRFGKPPYALVIDGRDALWFKAGKQPLNCKR